MTGLSIFLLAFFIASTAASSEFTLKCLVTYLRAENVNEDLFSDVESVHNSTECSDIISSFFDAFYGRFKLSQRFEDCVKTSLNGTGLKNAYILTEAVDRLDVGWKVWKTSSKNKRNKELHAILISGLKVVQENCHATGAKQDIAADFNRIVLTKKTFPEFQDYCVKKHLVHLGILNTNDYNSTYHPKTLSYEAGNCDLAISTMQDDSYREMEKTISDCIVNFYRENNFMEHYLKVEYVLAHEDLNQYEITFERDKFVQTLFTIMKKAREACNV